MYQDIKKIEDKHGTVYFRMALSHIFDVGHSNITSESVESTKAAIMEEAAANTSNTMPIMTPEFQCYLLDIVLELSQYSIWTLLSYVKKNMHISN